MKKKSLIITLLLVIGLVSITVGVTYAFFNYTRTGTENTLSVGRIYFNHTQDGRINLSDVFPINKNNINTDTKNVGTFEINIEGDTDYTGGIEYLVSAVNTHITTSTGQVVPISLDISVEGLGTYENNYFTERENKNSKIYKRLTGNGIMGDGNLLVGYIPQNTTLGTPNGINGTITIKAYIDQDKVAISDTYDGNESDNMGTTTEWVGDRVVLTTDEWNAFQNSGISFQVKVEANEDIWVEETLYDIVERQTVMDNIQSTYVSSSTGIDFSQISSDTNGKGVYTFSSTANDAYPVKYFRGAVENNNVLFGGICWKIVRTTDTGGVKLIYNGDNKGTEEVPNCDNTGTDTQITLNVDGQDVNTFKFNENANSPAYNGYMYGNVYELRNESAVNGAYFGNNFTYDSVNNLYALTGAKEGIDEYHHYTCNLTTANGTCESIRYYYKYITQNYFYFTLNNGKSINDAIVEMQINITNSNAKEKLDSWYESRIANNINYSSELEDTIFCNDRRITEFGGLNQNGGGLDTISSVLNYSGFTRANLVNKPSLSCRKNDAFTLPNGRGNGALSYPMALLTADEAIIAGGTMNANNDNFYLNNEAIYWNLTSAAFSTTGRAAGLLVYSTGKLMNGICNFAAGLRPVLSLKNSTAIVDNAADGTASKPYVIK